MLLFFVPSLLMQKGNLPKQQKGEMRMLYALIAFLPILSTLVLMMVFNRPAKEALPIAWGLAGIFGILVWKKAARPSA